MIWIAASIPFWLLGTVTVVVACWGLYAGVLASGRNNLIKNEAWSIYRGFTVLMIAGGIMLYVAARIAS